MTDRFSTCHAITAKWEGGWSNHPADPGGKTMYGVTEAVYHAWLKAQGKKAKPVRNITKDEALAIYRQNYWRPTAVRYNLRPGVDLATYDAAVNSGVSRGVKWLLASVGGSDATTVKRICAKRLSFVRALKTWATFGKGWTNRVTDIEAKGVAMALAAAGTVSVPEKLNEEAKSADTKSKTQAGGAGAGGAGAAGSVTQPELDPTGGWVLVAILAAAAVFVVFMVYRSHVNRRRAAAYAAEIGELT